MGWIAKQIGDHLVSKLVAVNYHTFLMKQRMTATTCMSESTVPRKMTTGTFTHSS